MAGFDPNPSSWDFLSVAAAALMAGVGWNPCHLRFSGTSVLLNFVTPSWRQASPPGLFLQRRSSITLSLRDGIFLRGLSGWTSSTATWPRPPGSLMAPLTLWVEGMAVSSAPVAVARVIAVCLLSQCMLVPLGCLLRDLQPSMEKARAINEPVDGRVQAWTRLALGHVHRNVCETIGRDQPTRMGEGKSQ